MITAGESFSYGKHEIKSGRDSFTVPRTNNFDFCDSSAIEHFSETSLCANMNDISISGKPRLLIEKDGFKPAKTPDNKDVPIKRELSFDGWSDESLKGVELGESYNPHSFIQSSDSLDNNCLLNGESVGAELYDDTLNRFEGDTVARFRNGLFLSSVSRQESFEGVKGYVSAMLTTAVRSAKFKDHTDLLVNRNENKSYTGYYSEHFDVNKPVYNKRLVEVNSRMVEVPWSESMRESDKLKRSQTEDLRRKSFRKKDVSKLIHYFEAGVATTRDSDYQERLPDVKMKIFEEVSIVREKEKPKKDQQRISRRPSHTAHLDLELVSHSSSSPVISPNIITPPLGFQNSFPPETEQDDRSNKTFDDAEVFNHVSVKEVANEQNKKNAQFFFIYSKGTFRTNSGIGSGLSSGNFGLSSSSAQGRGRQKRSILSFRTYATD